MTTQTPNSTCSTCRRPIAWAWTTSGMRIPVDPEPVPGGNLDVDPDGHGGTVVTYVKAEPDVARHVSHFATCPDEAQHRRPRGARRMTTPDPQLTDAGEPLPFPPSAA